MHTHLFIKIKNIFRTCVTIFAKSVTDETKIGVIANLN